MENAINTGAVRQKHRRHCLVVITCALMMFTVGAMPLSCAGIFFVSCTKYLGVSTTAFGVTMTIASLANLIALPFAGKLIEKFDVRIIVSFAVICVGGGLFVRGFATELWHWYVTAAVIGFGISVVVYLATPVLINRWFKDRAGFFIGLCMAFTGIGGMVFNALGGAIIDSSPEGWRMGYISFGLIGLCLTLPFSIFALRNRPADVSLTPYESGKQQAKSKSALVLSGVQTKKAMRMPAFYVMALFCGLVTLVSVSLNYWPTYAASLAHDYPQAAASAALLASMCAAGAAVGKLLLGAANDKNVRYGLLIGTLAGLMGLVLMWQGPSMIPMFLLGGFLFGMFFATASVQLPIMVKYVFGTLDYSSIYSKVSMVSALAAAFGAIVWGLFIDGSGFNYLFITASISIALCLAIGMYLIWIRKKIVFETEQIGGSQE